MAETIQIFYQERQKNGNSNHAKLVATEDKGYMDTDFEKVFDYSGAKDYMSKIYTIASTQKRLGYSLAYLVMTWQVIMMIVYYYKRAFIISILIIIFPLIAFSFVWDKLNDGKSQALSAWTREFVIDVFVQTFHAIIYAFVCNSIYATLADDKADFILMFIISTFMFQGEQILKQLFGGGGESLGSVAQTGKTIAVVAGVTRKTVTRVVTNTVGKNGVIRTGWRSYQGLKRDFSLVGVRVPFTDKTIGGGGFNFLASNTAETTGMSQYLPSEGEITPTIRKTAQMIYRFNNADTVSSKELAEALNTYKELKNARNGVGGKMTANEMKTFDAMMRKSGITQQQLEDIEKATTNAAVAAGEFTGDIPDDKASVISKRLRIELEAIFPVAKDESGNPVKDRKNSVADKMMGAVLLNLKEHGASSNTKASVADDNWRRKVKKVKQASKKVVFAKNGSDAHSVAKAGTERKERTSAILGKFQVKHGVLSDEEREKVTKFASKVAVVEQIFSDKESGGEAKVTQRQAIKAMKLLESDKELANVLLKHSKLQLDIDDLRYILSKKIKEDHHEILEVDIRTLRAEVENRKTQLVSQYQKIYAGATIDKDKLERAAEDIARLEYVDTGVKSKLTGGEYFVDAYDRIQGKGDYGDELVQRLMNMSSIQMDMKELGMTAKIGVGKDTTWASDTAIAMENDAHRMTTEYARGDKVEEDPFVSIMNIIEAAEEGAGEVRKIRKEKRIDKVLEYAETPNANEQVLNRKRDFIRRRNQNELVKSKEFAAKALELEGYDTKTGERKDDFWKKVSNYANDVVDPNEPTFEGRTRSEIRRSMQANASNMIDSAIGLVTEVAVTPGAAVVGSAVGAAMTEDGMPLGEMFSGAVAGMTVADEVLKTGSTLSFKEAREEERKRIEEKIKKRVKAEERERIRLKKVFDENKSKSAYGDGALKFIGATANMHIESSGRLSVTVHIMAENAEYVAISDTPGVPSSGWEAFQEDVLHVFKDNDPSKERDVYIYIRDAAGNIEQGIIKGMKL